MELKENILEFEEKKLPELLKMKENSIKSTLHHERKAETDGVKNEIVDWY